MDFDPGTDSGELQLLTSRVGLGVGPGEGGPGVGKGLGETVGYALGVAVGGDGVGDREGLVVGMREGRKVGDVVGAVGRRVGRQVGKVVGGGYWQKPKGQTVPLQQSLSRVQLCPSLVQFSQRLLMQDWPAQQGPMFSEQKPKFRMQVLLRVWPSGMHRFLPQGPMHF